MNTDVLKFVIGIFPIFCFFFIILMMIIIILHHLTFSGRNLSPALNELILACSPVIRRRTPLTSFLFATNADIVRFNNQFAIIRWLSFALSQLYSCQPHSHTNLASISLSRKNLSLILRTQIKTGKNHRPNNRKVVHSRIHRQIWNKKSDILF